jgi:hypothetical protein
LLFPSRRFKCINCLSRSAKFLRHLANLVDDLALLIFNYPTVVSLCAYSESSVLGTAALKEQFAVLFADEIKNAPWSVRAKWWYFSEFCNPSGRLLFVSDYSQRKYLL